MTLQQLLGGLASQPMPTQQGMDPAVAQAMGGSGEDMFKKAMMQRQLGAAATPAEAQSMIPGVVPQVSPEGLNMGADMGLGGYGGMPNMTLADVFSQMPDDMPGAFANIMENAMGTANNPRIGQTTVGQQRLNGETSPLIDLFRSFQ